MAAPPMKTWNLDLRLVVELIAYAGIWAGAFTASTSWLRWALSVTGPLAAAIVWAAFKVPGDSVPSGKRALAVPGRVRLGVELLVMGVGLWGWVASGRIEIALAFLVAVAIHLTAAAPRVRWLLDMAGDR